MKGIAFWKKDLALYAEIKDVEVWGYDYRKSKWVCCVF